MSLKLKNIDPSHISPLSPHTSSSSIHPSPISSGQGPRKFYLSNRHLVPPPLISCSPFVPPQLARLLMRCKKDSALGVKFEAKRKGWKKGKTVVVQDEITNMEAAMHTFVTPVLGRCEMVGDYIFSHGHSVSLFGDVHAPSSSYSAGKAPKVRLTRSVVLSALIHPDFENNEIMLRLCTLSPFPTWGHDLLSDQSFALPNSDSKDHDSLRTQYDEALRAHMIYHLTTSHHLPAKRDVVAHSLSATFSWLESLILDKESISISISTPEKMRASFVTLQTDDVLSLEILYQTYVQLIRNEFSALEALCPQGYIYTYDPPSIFARTFSIEILNRLFLLALKTFASQNSFANMKVFAFNTYAENPNFLSLVTAALAPLVHRKNGQGVRICSKHDLFRGPGGKFDLDLAGMGEVEKRAMLVLHNNSDGFGQNIETEGMGGSLDGAIGASSSAAASLERGRGDLLDFVC